MTREEKVLTYHHLASETWRIKEDAVRLQMRLETLHGEESDQEQEYRWDGLLEEIDESIKALNYIHFELSNLWVVEKVALEFTPIQGD